MAEETLIIETPEHVELQFALASLGNRFLACAIDHALQFLAMLAVLIIALTVNSTIRALSESTLEKAKAGSLWTIAILILSLFVIYFGYFALFEAFWNGQTPGKRLLKLRVIKDDGRPINIFEAFARNVIRLFDFMPTWLYSIGILTVFMNSKGKRLGDFVAGTVVIKERADDAPSFSDVFESDDSDDRGFDLARRRIAIPVVFKGEFRGITKIEIEIVAAFLRRREELPELPRQWMAWRIAMPILNKIRPQFDPDTFTYEGFLEELLARYRKTWN